MQNVKNEHKNDAVKQENKSFKTEDKFHKDDRNYRDDKLHKNDINHKKDEQKPSRTYKYLAFVSFKESKKVYSFGSDQNDFHVGDDVVVETVRGLELGKIVKESEAFIPNGMEIKPIIRKATPKDLKNAEVNVEKAKKALVTCNECIHKLGLDMNLIEAEYTLDCSKIIFVYVADERVDFRQLIKVLAEAFRVRIEMKQIGARQEAGRIGGIGPCGRELCCSSWMTSFVSVATGAARYQDISMNPQKLAGQCAKLKCCINYEVDTYVEAQKRLPSREIVLETKDNNYYHFKTDIFKREITYSTDKSFAANLITIPASRAFDVINMNKKGMKPISLEADTKPQPPKRDAQDILGQESVTRFDSVKKKKKKRPANKNNGENNGNGNGANTTATAVTNTDAPVSENKNNGGNGAGGNNRRNGGNNRNSNRENNRDRENNRENNKDNSRENSRENRENNRNNRPKQRPRANNDKQSNNDKPANNDKPQQPIKQARPDKTENRAETKPEA